MFILITVVDSLWLPYYGLMVMMNVDTVLFSFNSIQWHGADPLQNENQASPWFHQNGSKFFLQKTKIIQENAQKVIDQKNNHPEKWRGCEKAIFYSFHFFY